MDMGSLVKYRLYGAQAGCWVLLDKFKESNTRQGSMSEKGGRSLGKLLQRHKFNGINQHFCF
jgi:hypothetical protein